MLVPLQVAPARLLEGAAVTVRALEGRVACTLWSLPAGAGAGCLFVLEHGHWCCCRVLLLQDVMVVCALEPGRRVPLADV